jgi:hypothetical protein
MSEQNKGINEYSKSNPMMRLCFSLKYNVQSSNVTHPRLTFRFAAFEDPEADPVHVLLGKLQKNLESVDKPTDVTGNFCSKVVYIKNLVGKRSKICSLAVTMTLSSLNIVHMVYVISYQQLKMETN